MKKYLILSMKCIMMSLLIFAPSVAKGQIEKAIIKKYLTELPNGSPVNSGELQKYRMTAVYTNLDLYGNFMDKAKITGDYGRGFENGFVSWNNVWISNSKSKSEPFGIGIRQEYMDDFRYIPSSKMMNEEEFKDFPPGTQKVLARNLIWDMMSIEMFAWDYSDSLKLNLNYDIPEIKGEFDMADIGSYEHANIQVCWTGISQINNELCAVIEYRAIDNKVELALDQINTRGTEQYWGTTWISLKSRQIEYAEMYSGTIQEIEVKGLKDKFLIKTIRELWVERIK